MREYLIIKRTHISLTSLNTKKLVTQQTEAPQKDLRPRHKTVQREDSNSSISIFVRMRYLEK